MTLRVILHIGSTKTGSSALQSMLFAQRAALADAGVLYSEAGVIAGAQHLFAASLHYGAWQMHTAELPEDRDGYFRQTAAAMLEEAKSMGAHTLIISSEYFWEAFKADIYRRLRDAFAPARFEVVAFVRRQDEWALSSYLQAVKSGEQRTFGSWLPVVGRWTGGLHYYRVVRRWEHYLAAAKVHVLRYDDVKGNVLRAFAEAVQVDAGLENGAKLVNPSPSALSLERLLEVNRGDLDNESKARERGRIMREQRREAYERPVLSTSELADVIRLAQPSDQLLGRVYLSGRPLLADLVERPSSADQASHGNTR